MQVIPAYLMKVILSVPDEGYSSVPDEGYSRNESCTLNLISTFLLYKKIHVMYLYIVSTS